MRYKKNISRVTSVLLAILVTFSCMPQMSFADVEAEAAEENKVVAEVASAEAEKGEVQAAEPIKADATEENVKVEEKLSPMAGNNVNEANETSDSDDSEAKAAKQHIQDTYLAAGKRLISNGGTGVVQNGNNISVGLKTNGTGSALTSIRFNVSPSKKLYKVGVFLPENDEHIFYKVPTKVASQAIKKREATPYTFTATLKLYPSDTADADINNNSAKPLATQDFLITLEPEVSDPEVSIVAVNKKTNEVINGAKIELQDESNWQYVQPTNGKYVVKAGNAYYLKVTANGYKDYTNGSYTFDANAKEARIALDPVETKAVKFDVKDGKGNPITDATISVKMTSFPYSTVSKNSDGTYSLVAGDTYRYTVSKTGYSETSDTITAKEDTTVAVTLKRKINNYNVTFDVKDAEGKAVSGAKIVVTHEEESDDDEWGFGDTETVADKPQADGSYKLSKYNEYTVKVTADGYDDYSETYTPSGDDEDITREITLAAAASPDKDDLEAIKARYDKEFGALRPDFATDKNINDYVLDIIKGYSGLNTDGVTVTLKSSDEPEWIAADGTIKYNSGALNSWGMNSKNVSCVFTIKKGTASVDLGSRTATIGWDCDYVSGKMNEEGNDLTWDTIKGGNASQDAVTESLTLPQIMTSSARTAWSNITWTSSNPEVISIDKTGYDGITDAKKGTVHEVADDTQVTLTASFKVNESILNKNVDKEKNFTTFEKQFVVTVKGSKPAVTEKSLRELLKTYYLTNNDAAKAAGKKPYENLKVFSVGDNLNTTAVASDIQLPVYTRKIKDENNKAVFKNKEITVTAKAEDGLTLNGYRVNVDRFVNSFNWNTALTVSFTRDGITVSEDIPLTIVAADSDELDAEIAMMEQAKAHYWDGINNGANVSKDEVVNNLHSFQQMKLDADENPVWVYNANDKSGYGIIPDSYFDSGTLDFEVAGYNRFKSSNKNVIKHENLLVTRDKTDKTVKISSLLSSEKYGNLAEKHPNNEKLQKLYKQEVSVTVKVLGTETQAVETRLEINNVTDSVDENSKTLVENARGDRTVGAYFDIQLLQRVKGSAEVTPIHNAEKSSSISLKVPSDLQNVPEGMKREFSVIRLHEGVAETLNSSYNESDKSLTFESDKFSIYAIAYKDTEIRTGDTGSTGGNENPGDKPSTNSKNENTKTLNANSTAPKTGDSNTFVIWIVVAAVAICALVVLLKKRNNRK